MDSQKYLIAYDKYGIHIDYEAIYNLPLDQIEVRGLTFKDFLISALAEATLHLSLGGQCRDLRVAEDQAVAEPRGAEVQYREMQVESTQKLEASGVPLDHPIPSSIHPQGTLQKQAETSFIKNRYCKVENGVCQDLGDMAPTEELLRHFWSVQNNRRIHMKEVQWFFLISFTGGQRLSTYGLRNKGCLGVMSRLNKNKTTFGFGVRSKSLMLLDLYLGRVFGEEGTYRVFCFERNTVNNLLKQLECSSEIELVDLEQEEEEEAEDSDFSDGEFEQEEPSRVATKPAYFDRDSSDDEAFEENLAGDGGSAPVAQSVQDQDQEFEQEDQNEAVVVVVNLSGEEGSEPRADDSSVDEESGPFADPQGRFDQERPVNYSLKAAEESYFGVEGGSKQDCTEDVPVMEESKGEEGSNQDLVEDVPVMEESRGEEESNQDFAQDVPVMGKSRVIMDLREGFEEADVIHSMASLEEVEQSSGVSSEGTEFRGKVLWGQGRKINSGWLIQERELGSGGVSGMGKPRFGRKRKYSWDQLENGNTESPKFTGRKRARSGSHVCVPSCRHPSLVQKISAYFHKRGIIQGLENTSPSLLGVN